MIFHSKYVYMRVHIYIYIFLSVASARLWLGDTTKKHCGFSPGSRGPLWPVGFPKHEDFINKHGTFMRIVGDFNDI